MKVLIVEDDPMVGQINSRFAAKIPFVKEVVLSEGLEEAKAILQDKSFDILLLDVYFPGGRGPDLLQWIRNNHIHLNVIFITADKSPETVERALHLGAVDYIVKPFSFQRFKTALENARKRIEEIDRDEMFNQESLDQVFRRAAENREEKNSDEDELEKGMSYKTYELVLEQVKKYPKVFTSEEMAESLGMARVTIRRYLDYMEKKGILKVELQYGKIGRPLHHYRYGGDE